MTLDTIDLELLQFLQEDCKQTNKQLANKLHLSTTAVYERIKKLEREKIIKQYTAVVDPKKVALNLVVFCQIKLVQHSKQYVSEFEKEVAQLDEVLECYHVSGEYDYLLKIVVKDMEYFRSFMVNKLTGLNHIGSTQSSFTISKVKSDSILKIR